MGQAVDLGGGCGLSVPAAYEPGRDAADRRALALLAAWAVVVVLAVAVTAVREGNTLAYPVARVLFEDQFRSLGDGHLIPRDGETVTPAFAVIFMGPVFWIQQYAYYPLERLLGSATATTIERINLMILYQLGTLLVYRLLRHGNADRWVAFAMAATYAVFPYMLSRLLICNSIAPGPFLLWSELGRLENRPRQRLTGLLAATLSYPLTGFSAVLLALQDYWWSRGPARRTTLHILLATAAALAVVHFGVLVLWPRAQPELAAHVVTFDDNFNYPVFPYAVSRLLAIPVKLFEIAVLIAGTCIYLFAHPRALFPAIVDFIYCAGTNKGIRDHTMVGSTIGLLFILGVRANLFTGGSPRRNAFLVGGAAFALIYGHAVSGPSGFLALALAPDPPRPHLADVQGCIPPGATRCVVFRTIWPGFVPQCASVATYEPGELSELRIDDPNTVVFVAPWRFDANVKGRPYGPPEEMASILRGVAAKIRAGQLHATTCAASLVLLRAPDAGASDPGAAEMLDQAAAAMLAQPARPL
jgi:hypothetical protein